MCKKHVYMTQTQPKYYSNSSCKQRWTGLRRLRMSGCGTVGLRTHLLLACHDGEKTSSKRHINRTMFVWLPVASGWCYCYDTVLMHRYMRDASLYIPERFGADRTLYGEVTRTWCFMAKDQNGRHHHGQQVYQAAAPSNCALNCYLHVMLGRKQAVNVMSIGWCLSDFLCLVGGAMDMTQYWCTDIFRVTPSIFLKNLVKMGNCMLNL